jgi:hypothetical protein
MARTSGQPQMDTSDPIDGVFEDDQKNGAAPADALTTVSAAMRVQTRYTTAMVVQKPRDLDAITKRVLKEAELAAATFYYQWGQGKGLVEGVSIEGAMIMVRNWGNCVADSRVVEEGPMHWIIDGIFIDLESGFTLSRQFRQRKSESHQKTGKDGDAERKVDIAFQIAQSKSQRNVVVRAMPGWLVAAALEKAKEAEAKGYATKIPEMIAKSVEAYGKLGVKMVDLEKKVGTPNAGWTSDDIRVLLALHRGIMARETSVPTEFPWLAPPAETPDPKAAATPDAGATPPAQASADPPPTPPATPQTTGPVATEAQAAGPECIVCGKPVPGDKAAWVEAQNRWRHTSCALPVAPAETKPTAPVAPAKDPPKGKVQRRPEDEGLAEPPANVKLPHDDEGK